jgi:hypothetical protein
MPEYSAPGVYIEEVEAGPHPIEPPARLPRLRKSATVALFALLVGLALKRVANHRTRDEC